MNLSNFENSRQKGKLKKKKNQLSKSKISKLSWKTLDKAIQSETILKQGEFNWEDLKTTTQVRSLK